MNRKKLHDVFDDLPVIHIVDIGASEIDGPPPYECWRHTGRMRLTGFEPSPDEHERLLARSDSDAIYVRAAVGDGGNAILNICRAPGMTSLLEPNLEVLQHFHGFEEWAEVIRRIELPTVRLDDVPETDEMDYLKMDAQGSELSILSGGESRLSEAVCIQTEVNFVPFYSGQPLFAEIDIHLRKAGFVLHSLTPLIRRTFKPMLVENSIYRGLNQVLWADAIYFRAFTDLEQLSDRQLLCLAAIAHDIYGSFDLAAMALKSLDDRDAGDRCSTYYRAMGFSQ